MASIKECSWRVLYVAVAYAVMPVTVAAQHSDDTLVAKRAAIRPLLSAASGEARVLDTLRVIAGPGVRGHVGVQDIRTRGLASDDVRTFSLVVGHGSQLAYTVAADSGYVIPSVVFDNESMAANGTITATRSHLLVITAERAIVAGSPNRKLYELLRRQLTASDPVWVFVDIECEKARLLRAFPDSGEKLVDAAEQKAVDLSRDAKALRRIDAALRGHFFGGCAEDRKTYQKASEKKAAAPRGD